MSDDDSLLVRIALSVVVIIAAIPGLVIEPGPLSELIALGALGAIWGVDMGPADGGGGGS